MVTTTQEYNASLSVLQSVNPPAYALLPTTEKVYHINASTRTIDAPKFLSVEKDFKAETIYFAIDRYVNYMDLADTCCIIQYNNPEAEEKGTRYYAVPFYDVYKMAHVNKIVFPWCLDAHVAKTAGTVEFSIRFFKIGEILNDQEQAEYVVLYNFNTLPATSQVLHGLTEKQLTALDDYYLTTTQYEYLISEISKINYLGKVYWTVLNEEVEEAEPEDTTTEENLNDTLDNGNISEEVIS